jgi:hypothetical protein
MPRSSSSALDNFWTLPLRTWESLFDGMNAAALYWAGVFQYNNDFLNPAVRAYYYIIQEELKKLERNRSLATEEDYSRLVSRHRSEMYHQVSDIDQVRRNSSSSSVLLIYLCRRNWL